MNSNRLDWIARAAMLGLLSAAQVGCSESEGASEGETGGSTSGGSSMASGGAEASGGSETSSGGDQMGGSGGEVPMGVYATEVIPDLTVEDFTERCEEVEGMVETHATCGGHNTCKGFSYDVDTDVLSDHTCRGYNTCSGFSCVVPE